MFSPPLRLLLLLLRVAPPSPPLSLCVTLAHSPTRALQTPRAQRTSADVQTWEFSHHKFLRGRPDLLEEIKRKALEPDPSLKHRVELPGEVAAQLSQMREDNRRLMVTFQQERQKFDRLASVTKAMYDVVIKSCGSAFFSYSLSFSLFTNGVG